MIDLDSETWRDVSAVLDALHEQAVAELKSPALDLPTTQFVRGRLMVLEAMQSLPAMQQAAATDLPTTPESYF